MNRVHPGQAAPAVGAGARVMGRLDELARFSSETGALTRLYLSTEHKAAALQVLVWMQEAGMATHIDAVGSVVGRYEGDMPGAPALLLGSHIDTVRNAGRYDGAFGVIAAIEAVTALKAANLRRPFAIEVIAFGDEEGVRFPVTLTSSRAVAGTLPPSALDAEDDDRISVREALQQFGCNPFDVHTIARPAGYAFAYCELHIEQGPVLQTEALPVGIVTAINGASRFTLTVGGVAGHAGTVPMALRQDALCAAAEMILAIEQEATETADLVATVGRIEAAPGATNVIPSQARFTLDIRSPSDATRDAAVGRLRDRFTAIAERRRTRLAMEKTYEAPAATCAPALMEAFEAAIGRLGLRSLRLPSGAGHDGLAMIALCPIAMLFVRCKDGISHNPAESIEVEDADIATQVLVDVLRHLDGPAAA